MLGGSDFEGRVGCVELYRDWMCGWRGLYGGRLASIDCRAGRYLQVSRRRFVVFQRERIFPERR